VSPLRFILLGILIYLVVRAVKRAMGGDKPRLEAAAKQPPLPPPPAAPPPPPIEDVDGKDPHEILGVARGAKREAIRAAYQRLVKEYHPDRTATLASEIRDLAEKRTSQINRAYDILMRVDETK
jgi:DnaJ like chaperone protein